MLRITEYLQQKINDVKEINLTFICTHNSRRSQISQVWAQVAANYFKIPNVHCYSGGTTSTAFNFRAINTLQQAGFEIRKTGNSDNPVYLVSYADDVDPVTAFSKEFSHKDNPRKDFAAVMTCAEADDSCPFVPGAEKRISLPYDDPKDADGTAREEAIYADINNQIAREIFFAFSKAKA